MNKMYYVDNNKLNVLDNIDIQLLEESDIGFNAPIKVIFLNKKGFLKNSNNSSKTLDKFEFLISIIGNKLGINMANTYIVRGQNEGIISENVLLDDEELLMISDLNNLLKDFFSVEELSEYRSYLDKLNKIVSTNYTLSIAESTEDIIRNINYLPILLSKMNLNKNLVDEITKSYIEMLYLDCLSGNKDRNMKNYGIIKTNDNQYRFCPLFDNSTISMPNIDDNYIGLNSILMDRDKVLDILRFLYPNIIDDLESKVIDYNEFINIQKNILDDNDIKWFDSVTKFKEKYFDNIKSNVK